MSPWPPNLERDSCLVTTHFLATKGPVLAKVSGLRWVACSSNRRVGEQTQTVFWARGQGSGPPALPVKHISLQNLMNEGLSGVGQYLKQIVPYPLTEQGQGLPGPRIKVLESLYIFLFWGAKSFIYASITPCKIRVSLHQNPVFLKKIQIFENF